MVRFAPVSCFSTPNHADSSLLSDVLCQLADRPKSNEICMFWSGPFFYIFFYHWRSLPTQRSFEANYLFTCGPSGPHPPICAISPQAVLKTLFYRRIYLTDLSIIEKLIRHLIFWENQKSVLILICRGKKNWNRAGFSRMPSFVTCGGCQAECEFQPELGQAECGCQPELGQADCGCQAELGQAEEACHGFTWSVRRTQTTILRIFIFSFHSNTKKLSLVLLTLDGWASSMMPCVVTRWTKNQTNDERRKMKKKCVKSPYWSVFWAANTRFQTFAYSAALDTINRCSFFGDRSERTRPGLFIWTCEKKCFSERPHCRSRLFESMKTKNIVEPIWRTC